jgi:hypothetical protein
VIDFAHAPPRAGRAAEARIGGFQPFSAPGTAYAETRATGMLLGEGVQPMSVSKFETFAFAIGFIATGFLTLVALPLAA